MCQRADWFISDNAGVIKNLLEFGRGRVAIFFREVKPDRGNNGIERKR